MSLQVLIIIIILREELLHEEKLIIIKHFSHDRFIMRLRRILLKMVLMIRNHKIIELVSFIMWGLKLVIVVIIGEGFDVILENGRRRLFSNVGIGCFV